MNWGEMVVQKVTQLCKYETRDREKKKLNWESGQIDMTYHGKNSSMRKGMNLDQNA